VLTISADDINTPGAVPYNNAAAIITPQILQLDHDDAKIAQHCSAAALCHTTLLLKCATAR
jgi:hypothetical protein